MVLQLFIIAAGILEVLRITLLAREMSSLAKEKGESPFRWGGYTVLLWVGTELLVILIWYLNFGYNLTLVVGVILSILIARALFYFLKRELESKETSHLEDKIEEIGSSMNP